MKKECLLILGLLCLPFCLCRRLLLDSSSQSRVPDDFLFNEDIQSTSLDAFGANPISSLYFTSDQSEFFNLFRVKTSSSSVSYTPSPNGDFAALSTFYPRTYTILFPDYTSDDYSIIALKNVDVSGSSRLSASLDEDFSINQLYWGLYSSGEEDITKDIEETLLVSGLENVLVLSTRDDDHQDYFDEDYVFWRTFSYGSTISSKETTQLPEMKFPNVLLLYGTQWGAEMTGYDSSYKMIVFFTNLDFIAGDSGEIGCSSKNLEIESCSLTDYFGSESSQIKDNDGGSHQIYPIISGSAVILSFKSNNFPEADENWQVILPWQPSSESDPEFETASIVSLGILDEDDQLVVLSGPQNGNSFSNRDGSNFLYSASVGESLEDLMILSDEVKLLAGSNEDSSALVDGAVWVDVSIYENAGAESSTAELKIVCPSSICSSGLAGAMLCFGYDFRGSSFEMQEPFNDGGSSACFKKVDTTDRFCLFCVLDDQSTTTIDEIISVEIPGFVLPSSNGQGFSSDSYGYLFGSDGALYGITRLSFYGDVWSPGYVRQETESIEVSLGLVSQRIQFDIQTDNGVPQNGQIVLERETNIGVKALRVKALKASFEPLCYIETDEGGTVECQFEIENKGDIPITLGGSVGSGLISIFLFDLGVSDEYDLADGDFTQFYIRTYTESGKLIDEPIESNEFRVYFVDGDVSLSHSASYSISAESIVTELVIQMNLEGRQIYENELIQISFFDEKGEELQEDFVLLGQNSNCIIETGSSSQIVSTDFLLCRIDSGVIQILPGKEENQEIGVQSLQITITNVIVASVGLQISLTLVLSEDGFAILESEENPIVLGKGEPCEPLGSLQSAIYSGVSVVAYGELKVALEVSMDSDDPPKIMLILPRDQWGSFSLHKSAECSIDGEEVGCYQKSHNTIELIDIRNDLVSGKNMSISIEGVAPPLGVSDGENVTVILVGVDQNESILGLTSVSVEFDDVRKEEIGIIYIGLLQIDSEATRTKVDLSFYGVSSVEIPDNSEIRVLFPQTGNALIKSGPFTCSVKLDDQDISRKCSFISQVFSISLSSLIPSDSQFTVTLKNVAGPDEPICSSPPLELYVFSEETGQLIAASSSIFNDFDLFGFSQEDPQLDFLELKETNKLEVPIGFYEEIGIASSFGYFGDQVTFTLGSMSPGSSSAFALISSEETGIGESSSKVLIGVKASGSNHPGSRLVEIQAASGLEQDGPLPILEFISTSEKGSLIVNNGKTLYIESGKVSRPISVCVDRYPIETISFLISSEEEDVFFFSDSIEFSSQIDCRFFKVDVPSSVYSSGSYFDIVFSTEASIFEEKQFFQVYIEIASVTSVSTEWSTESSSPFSVTFKGETTKDTISFLYVAPTSEFDYDIETLKTMKMFASGEIELQGNTIFQFATANSDLSVLFEINEGLLCGVEYAFSVLTVGSEDYDDLVQDYFTTEKSEYSAVQMTIQVTLKGNSGDSLIESEFLCELSRALRVPFEDIVTANGTICEEVESIEVDYSEYTDTSTEDSSNSSSDGEDNAFSDSTTETTLRSLKEESISEFDCEESTGKNAHWKSLERGLKEFSDSSSSSSDSNGLIEIIVLPPMKKSQNYTVTSELQEISTATLSSQLQGYFGKTLDIEVVSTIEPVEIALPELESGFEISSTDSSITMNDLGANGNGSFCFIVYGGGDTITTSNILSGSYKGEEGYGFGCEKLDGFKSLKVKGLDAETDYTIAYFLRSVDVRETAESSEIYFQEISTEASLDGSENDFEEFQGILALSLAIFCFFFLVLS